MQVFRNIAKKAAAFGLVCIGVAFLSLSIRSSGGAGHKDFIAYWAAGQRLVRHANPYDFQAILALENANGYPAERPLMMRNLPIGLPLAVPLGFFQPDVAVVLWSLMIAGSLMLSIHLLRGLYVDDGSRLHLVGYAFAPAFACMQLGQTATFMLLGLAAFLRLQGRSRFAAGACLTLAMIKPQVLLPFFVVLLVWAMVNRAFGVLLGAAAGAICTTAVAAWFDPRIWLDYLPVLRDASDASMLVPTLSSAFRVVLRAPGWVQYTPVFAAVLWALWYFRRNRGSWDWQRHGLQLLPVSVLVMPFGWFTDQLVLLPAILDGIRRRDACGQSLLLFGILDAAALALVFFAVPVGTPAYLWTAPAWFLWYLSTPGATDRVPAVRDHRKTAVSS